MWSSESAPTRIFGGCPVRLAYVLNALYVNSFRSSMPLQSGQLSCSIENESKVDARGSDLVGATTGTSTEMFHAPATDATLRATAPARA